MNPSPLDSAVIVIPAADASGNPGVAKCELAGVMLLIRKATAPFRMQLDGNAPFDTEEGFKFIDAGGVPFSRITFYNDALLPVTVQVYVGSLGVDFVGANEIKPAPTVPLGNLGIVSHAAVAKIFGQKLTVIAIANGGTNYTVGDVLTILGGTGTPATIQVTSLKTVGHGVINTAAIVNPGNYSANPNSPNAAVGGTGANASIALTTFANLTGAVVDWAAGWLTITNAANLIIPNGVGVNARKSILIKVKAGGNGLLVMDAAGNVMRALVAGESENFETAAPIQVVGDAAVATSFTVSELYYL